MRRRGSTSTSRAPSTLALGVRWPWLVRRSSLEKLRRLAHAVGSDEATGAGGQRRSRRRVRSDASLVRAMLASIHGVPSARSALAVTAAEASQRTAAAVAARLLEYDRPEAAHAVASARPGARWSTSTLISIAQTLTDEQVLTAIADAKLPAPDDPAADRASHQWPQDICVEAAVRLGRLAQDRGDHAVALERFDEASTLRSDHWLATWRGWSLWETGDVAQAQDAVSSVLAGQPHHVGARLLDAAIAAGRGDAARAASVWREVGLDKATALNDRLAAWDGLDRLAAHDDALAVGTVMVERHPQAPAGRARLAVSLWRLGRSAEADTQLGSLWDDLDAGAVRACAFFLGRTGRAVQAYAYLSHLSILVRGRDACREVVEALRTDGHHRLARQAAARALGVFADDRHLVSLASQLDATSPAA